jgi:site-specific recombinase XerD
LFYSPVSADGEQHPITASAIGWIIKESRNKINTKKKFTSHTLRHSFATHLLEDGMNILTIKELMGHKRIETTMLYLQIAQLDNHSKFSPLDTLYKK